MGRRTLLWRCEGYVRRTLRECLGLPQQAFFDSLDMRAGRTVADPVETASINSDDETKTAAEVDQPSPPEPAAV